jgi:hypothetical protein
MKTLSLSMAIVCLMSFVASSDNSGTNLGLPALHVIKTISLSPSYSCRSVDEAGKGYANTALFLSDYAKQRNSPDLLLNGACGASDYFEASTSGDNMSLIADLVSSASLEEVTAVRAFNLQRVHSFEAYSRYVRAAKVQLNHTYAVLLNQNDKRGLFVFTVIEYTPNKAVELRYAVKSYQVTPAGHMSSPGFEWEKKNAK